VIHRVGTQRTPRLGSGDQFCVLRRVTTVCPGCVAMFRDHLAVDISDKGSVRRASVSANDAGVPFLMFHQVPEEEATKNCVHVDLQTTDVPAEVARLIGLGAKEIRPLADNNNRWVSLIDPEGNEFDLVAI
jgi:predicted enzyme related to lactoylglutathione lyase